MTRKLSDKNIDAFYALRSKCVNWSFSGTEHQKYLAQKGLLAIEVHSPLQLIAKYGYLIQTDKWNTSEALELRKKLLKQVKRNSKTIRRFDLEIKKLTLLKKLREGTK